MYQKGKQRSREKQRIRENQGNRKSPKSQTAKLKVGWGIITGLTTFTTFISGILPQTQIVNAADNHYIQSENYIEMNLTHSHSSNCYGRKWIPCGGYWSSYYEPFYAATCWSCSNCRSDEVVNGVRLGDIHNLYHTDEKRGTHEGEYVTALNCDLNQIGTFYIERKTENEEIWLEAGIKNVSSQIQEYTITFSNGEYLEGCLDEEGNIVSNQPSKVLIDSNGIYTVEAKWYDLQEMAWHTSSYAYTDISSPINLVFYNDEDILYEGELLYGSELPDLLDFQIKKYGYNFAGFYLDDKLVYDENLLANNQFSTYLDDMKYEIFATWEAKNYQIHYGDDLDGDGILDNILNVTFGKEYDGIASLPNIGNSTFTGFYIGDEKIIDEDGNPISEVWKWDVSEGTVLTPGYYTPPATTPGGSNNSNTNAPQDNHINNPDEQGVENEIKDGNEPINNNGNSINHQETGGAGNLDNNNHDSNSQNNNNQDNNRGSRTNANNQNQSSRADIDNNYNAYRRDEGGTYLVRQGDQNLENNDVIETVTEEIGVEDYLAAGNEISENELEELSRVQMEKEKKEKMAKVIGVTAISLASVTAFSGLLYALFLMRGSVVLFSDENSKRRKITTILPQRENGGYEVTISSKMLENSTTGKYILVVPNSFVLKHSNENMIFKLPNRKWSEIMAKEYTFYAK